MNGLKTVTDKTLRAWLDSGAVDRSVGDALMFVASTAAARRGKASWILRYRHCGRQREKVLGRYPDLSLKDARELARKDRVLLRQGTDVAALKSGGPSACAKEHAMCSNSASNGCSGTLSRATST